MSSARAAAGRRGQPLWALGSLLLCWIAVRAALIDLPAAPPDTFGEVAREIIGLSKAPRVEPVAGAAAQGLAGPMAQAPAAAPIHSIDLGLRVLTAPEPLPSRPPILDNSQHAAGHNLLWMAAMSAIPMLPGVATLLAGQQAAPARQSLAPSPALRLPSRWSGDAWLVWRPDSRSFASIGPITPVSGGSQAGALLRYDLAPASRNRPAAYIRAVGALTREQEQDLAIGLVARPLSRLPIGAHGELRLSRREGGTTLRPAAFLSGGIDDAPLAAGLTARGYAQAGYVAGREATAFADGGLIAERPVWRDRDAALAAGAGTWGGAQRGAARLDIGPTASLRFRLGETTARLSADYRLRVAGNAEPASGAALTLSAGF